jgi:hypothetical protein
MKSSSNNVRFILGGIAVLAVGFAFGRATKWLEDPITPPKPAMTASGITEQAGVNVGTDSRVGGVFSADGSTGGRTVPTVGEITGGQPLEDWLKRVMTQEDELFRMQNFMKLLESLNTPADIETALKVVMAGGGRGRGGFGGPRFTEISMLMSKYVQLDPKGAMVYSTKLEGGEKFMATSSALRTWTRLSPDAALSWAASEGAAISMDFGRGPGGGGGEQEEAQPKTNFALMSVVSQLAKTDIDKALSTGATMELGRFGDRMVETLAGELFNQKGADAMRSYADSLPAGAFRDQFVQQAAERLAGKDPAGTAQWVAKMETGDTKRRALGRVVDSWAKTDFASASSYVASQPVGPDMDSARSEIINRLSKDDPKQAWGMITSITDAERQARTARQVGPALVKADPQNGPAIIAATPLPEEVKQQAVAPQREGGPGGGFGGFGGRGGGRPGGGGGR